MLTGGEVRNAVGALSLALSVCTVGCLGFFREEPKLEIKLGIPDKIAAGERFKMVVEVSNPHPAAVVLDSIDIDIAFLDGFQVVAIDPSPTDTSRIPVVEQRSWTFGTSVRPKGSTQVSFTLRPIRSGHYTGNVEACNQNQDCSSVYADVAVP